jgi:hypothetical protein
MILYSTASRPALIIFDGYRDKRPDLEADHSPPSSAKVKNVEAMPQLHIILHVNI